jgi:hypothetical protein
VQQVALKPMVFESLEPPKANGTGQRINNEALLLFKFDIQSACLQSALAENLDFKDYQGQRLRKAEKN